MEKIIHYFPSELNNINIFSSDPNILFSFHKFETLCIFMFEGNGNIVPNSKWIRLGKNMRENKLR